MSNLNKLAKTIAEKEAGKEQVSIAQIKEIIKLLSVEIRKDPHLIASLLKLGSKHEQEK